MHTFKLYSCGLFMVLSFLSGWSQQIQISDENFVMAVQPQEPFKRAVDIDAAPLEKKITSITYYDGLGRPKQQIAVGASPAFSSKINTVPIDWEVGQGSTPNFIQNGGTSENNREMGISPTGQQSILWKCGNDAANDADGGWNTKYFQIDNRLGYRYSVWVKRTGSQNGSTYHGTQNVNTLDGVQDNNPYFFYGDLPQLDTWYLIVGIIHPYNYTGPDQGISGVYDINGNRVLDGKEFKWRNDVHTSRFRSYLFYSTDTNVRQYFWNPMIQKLDGTEQGVTDVSVFNTTNELTMDWSQGNGGTPFFNQNGGTSENRRLYGNNPHGEFTVLWRCGNDAGRDADGGWNTDYFTVDKTLEYRYSVWVKRTGSQDGLTYHGTNNVENLNGVAQSNPYFWSGDLPKLNTWYQMRGVIHPYGYTGGDKGISGVYDIDGNKVSDGNEFRWSNTTTTARFRSYLYYSIDTNVRQYFWNPVVRKLGGDVNPAAGSIQEETIIPEDIVTHLEYDEFGRQAKEYLPFSASGNNGSYRNVNTRAHINGYYQNKYPDDFPGITDLNQINAYSQSVYEASPLNRVKEQGAPGAAWKVDTNSDTDHTIKFDWNTNAIADKVVYFEVAFENGNTEKPKLTKRTDDYAAGQLYVTITKDENWQPGQTYSNDHTTKEYKDKLGRVILKRTFNNNIAHDTYYVYDDFGNLTYELSPKVDISDGVSQSELDELSIQYRYDYRNRPYAKKIPGKEWEYVVYNKLDWPIMTQDANLRANNEWLFTKYDAFGRVAYTGKITDNRDHKIMQDEVNALTTPLWVERGSAVMIGGATMYYNNGGYPNTQNAEVLTVNYYDDYDFLGTTPVQQLANPGTVYSEPVSNSTKSLATGTKVKVLGTSYWITTVSYHDKKARPICVATTNEYLNTSDIVETKFDFVGKVEETTTRHKKGNNAVIVTIDRFEYDHIGRLTKQTQTIGNQEETIVENTYDALGQLESKAVGGGLQNVDYSYNVRGWLKGINDVNNMGNDLFAFGLSYNNPTENLGADPLYNNNISETIWKTANDLTKRAYGFNYDAMNRLIKAKSSDGRYDLTSVSYDRNGNILALQRKGTIVLSPDISRVNDFGIMDNLGYTYDVGNKLMRVADTGNKTYGFKDGTNTNDDFEYDDNGNMIIDRNKGITGMTYNHLNMPVEVTFNNSSSKKISYVYDAYGVKLKKQVTNGTSVTMTEYANNYIYENNELSFFDHKEGYVEPESDGTYTYIYEYRDHLGSVRLRYADNDKDGKIDVVRNGVDIDGDNDYTNEIREEKNYYPFGLVQKGYNYTIRGRKHNFGFNGKEEQNSLDFGMLDFGARNYDPALGRWMNIDPLAEFMPSFSPFSYAFDNPVLYIDIDGMLPMGPGDRVAAAKSINSSDTRTYKMVGGTAAYNDNYVDCSEFAREVALADGYDPGRDSRTQAKYYQNSGQWITNVSEVKAGDFVYWRKPGTTRISHTGVVARVNDDGTLHIIQSTYNKGGISINDKYNTSTDGALWKGGKFEREFVGAGRPAGEGFIGPLAQSQFESTIQSFSLIIPEGEYIKYFKESSAYLNRETATSVSTITPNDITPSPTPGPVPGGGTIPVPAPAPAPAPLPIIPPPTPILD
ncbi:DUF6443 domain-containing protein [Aquimarina mytili]|uniref:DUF6443 domain-containing protein n=1 Tax=Aquimarina mytili TaxID=874423 RepID=UPI0031D7A942